MNRENGLAIALVLLALYSTVAGSPVWSADTTELRIEFSGLQQASGTVYIAVYNSEESWLGDTTVAEQLVVIESSRKGEVVIASLRLPPGEYALTAFHDANGNGELDTNFIGIPKEPVAMSNNARPRFGPPRYRDARFTLGRELLVQRITLKAIR